MVAYKSAIVIVLTELVDPENEKPLRRKTREWIKSRRERERESGYFQNIFQELKVEDHVGFKDMFRLKVADYKFLFNSLMTETVII